jgi:cell division protein FtsQ
MASSSNRKSGSSGRSSSRRRVVIGADETVRVSYTKDQPQIESERRRAPRQAQRSTPGRATGASGMGSGGAGRRIANDKREERDRRRRALARRRILAGVGIALLAAAAVWGLVALWKAPLLPIKHLDVSGESRLTRSEVVSAAAVPKDATLLKVSPAQIEDRLEKLPWISDARVSRALPGTLRIAVVERRPVAVVDVGGTNIWLVSSDGYWLGKRTAEDSAALLAVREIEDLRPRVGAKVVSPELKNAIAVISGLSPELKSRVRSVSAPSVDKTALILKDDVQIFVGSAEGIAKKDRVAREILAREKRVIYINVRVVSRPTWRGLEKTE